MAVLNEEEVLAYDNNVGAADESLKGVGMADALQAELKRKEQGGGEKRSGVVADVVASLVNAVSNVPDALATSIMVGVSPIHGL